MHIRMFTRKGFYPVIIIIISIIVSTSYGLFFYLQYAIERDTKDRLVAQQTNFQIESTKKISTHISSDLNSVLVALHGLANSLYLQQGDLSSDGTKKLMQETYSQINTITIVDRLFILGKDNTATIFIVPKGQTTPFFGSDNISFQDLVNQTRTKLVPAFLNGYKGLDNKYRIAITYPILNRETKQYMGTIAALVPTVEFFEHYGNVHDISKQYLVAYDRIGTYLATPSANFLGKFFFSSEIQQLINHNANLNNQIRRVVLSGQPAEAVYGYGLGERLSTGYPIFEQGRPAYSIFVVTPTSVIYSQVSQVLFLERIEMFLLLAGTTAAIALLVIFLLRWNSNLGKEVKRRTHELEQLNKQLGAANEQLKLNDKMQKEFINVAAHELRTPLQPIISYSSLALKDKVDKIEAMIGIDRNARRLQKLSTDLLAVSRIEGGNLPYKMENVRINDLILDVVNSCADAAKVKAYDLRSKSSGKKNGGGGEKQEEVLEQLQQQLLLEEGKEEREVLIETELDHSIEEIYGDKDRLAQVLFNIIDNALKFTNKGRIKIESHVLIADDKKKDDDSNNKKIEIKISDTGDGIPEDILPHIFGKFVTKSGARKENKHGSGLGLFISKAIVKSHNGEITAYNNDRGGATVVIVLPMDQKQNENKNNNDDDDDNNRE
jgi:signal transduction histidine kinase